MESSVLRAHFRGKDTDKFKRTNPHPTQDMCFANLIITNPRGILGSSSLQNPIVLSAWESYSHILQSDSQNAGF